jgi:hypothetical protein
MSNDPRDCSNLSWEKIRLIKVIKAMASSGIEERMMLKCSLRRKKKTTRE